MRKSVPYVLAALIALTAVLPVSAGDHPQKPGKWKVSMQMDMPGMPIKMPPVNVEVCLTEEDLKDPQKVVPTDPKSDCKIGDYKIDGKTASWSVSCPKQNMTGKGEMTFSDESYSGWMKMKVGEQEMNTKYTGKWLGTCTK